MSRTRSARPEQLAGHKRVGGRVSVAMSCECGWRSSSWTGPGARWSADAEWREHRASHQVVKHEQPMRGV